MPEELSLVTELAIILVAAGIFTILSKVLKQPLILGYIFAGFLVGPHLGLFPQFSTDSIHEWSELGIIFLLFGLGLEFSFKKLLKIGSSAFITAGVKCIGMFAVGIIAGRFMGWTPMECIFLGGLLGMSSTTIIIKAYDDLGLKNKPYAPLIFGSLVFEDLIAVLLLVLLSTIAVTGKFEGGQMVFALGKLVFFIILWFLVGLYLIPLLLKRARAYLSNEILLLVSIGLCFGMVVIANLVGFSSALGAFVMGSLLAETLEAERIEHLTANIKDLFGAIFFVSVGMMLDPAVVAQHWLPILVITLITICGILVFSTTGVLLSGGGLNNAVHAGFSLCQLGEFAFIIAGLGCSLGVMRDFIYPVIIAVSVITTFTTPYMIKLGDPAAAWLKKVLPDKFLSKIDPPQKHAVSGSKAEKNDWKNLLGSLALRLVLYGVISIAIIIGSAHFLPDLLDKLLPSINDTWHDAICTGATLLVLLPFLYGIAVGGKSIKNTEAVLVKKNSHNVWGVLAIVCIRITIALVIVIQVIESHFELSWWSALLIVAMVVVFYVILRRNVHSMSFLEDTFMGNLNAREEQARKAAPVTAKLKEALGEYNISQKIVTVSPYFQFAGSTLREMPFRKTSGANVIKIQRGGRSIVIPSGSEKIFPGDRLLVVGTDEQLASFEKIMDLNTIVPVQEEKEDFVVQAVSIQKGSFLEGKTLRDTDMRASGCMVVSVLSNGVFHTNPTADYDFKEGDVAWIAGEKSSVEWYK